MIKLFTNSFENFVYSGEMKITHLEATQQEETKENVEEDEEEKLESSEE